VAARFKQVRKVLPKVDAALTALARLGVISRMDGGGFYARR